MINIKNKKSIIKIIVFIGIITLFVLGTVIYYKHSQTYKNITEYNNPIIPHGFKKVETEKASWELVNGVPKDWNNGLVIEDESGNQFVWVPVDDVKGKYKVSLLKDTWDDALPGGISNEINQVYKYGGFYIARYEAGVPNELQNNLGNIGNKTNNVSGIPVSKKGTIPWNYIEYKKAKFNCEIMYSNEYIQSGMMTNTQWNVVLHWLEKSGYNLKENCFEQGNYSNVNFDFNGLYSIDNGISYQYGEDISKNDYRFYYSVLLSCGATDRNVTNNIYDLFGNLSELTTRYGNGYCEVKGGDYNNVNSDHIKRYLEPSSRIGFRVVLYMK